MAAREGHFTQDETKRDTKKRLLFTRETTIVYDWRRHPSSFPNQRHIPVHECSQNADDLYWFWVRLIQMRGHMTRRHWQFVARPAAAIIKI